VTHVIGRIAVGERLSRDEALTPYTDPPTHLLGRAADVSGERIGAGSGGEPWGRRPRTGRMLLMRPILS
jgi:hypothetical protein